MGYEVEENASSVFGESNDNDRVVTDTCAGNYHLVYMSPEAHLMNNSGEICYCAQCTMKTYSGLSCRRCSLLKEILSTSFTSHTLCIKLFS